MTPPEVHPCKFCDDDHLLLLSPPPTRPLVAPNDPLPPWSFFFYADPSSILHTFRFHVGAAQWISTTGVLVAAAFFSTQLI